jgi:hypothetical protein
MLKLLILAFILFAINLRAEIVEGPWIKKGNRQIRYVTEYEVQKIKTPFVGMPWIEEDCHDQGTRFANWSKKHSYEMTYSGSIDFSLLGFIDLGFGADRSRSVEITFQRWITPELGIKARHILHEEYERWNGITYKEIKDKTGEIRVTDSSDFSVDKINYGISVVRIVLARCEND